MQILDRENTLVIELATGAVVIELFPDVAPLHVARVKELARAGEYDNVAFHRVFEGFVAQTGDVLFGDLEDGYNPFIVGAGGSALPDLPPEFSDISFTRGIVGMARGPEVDSANSQFFIMLAENTFLDGLYTAFGEVAYGMHLVDAIKLGDPARNGAVTDPDRMVDVEVAADVGPEDGIGLGLTEAEAREVALLYETGLDRDGDIDLRGLNFWIDRRETALDALGLAAAFLDSDELQANAEAFLADGTDLTDANIRDAAAFSDDAYVAFLYDNVLDREPDEGGFMFWRGRLDALNADPDTAGEAREALLLAFAESNENAEGLDFVDSLSEVAPSEWGFIA